MSSRNHIVELESLRGLMALWVILGHLLSASGFDPAGWAGPLPLLGRGTEAVNVFILLSGFVISLLLDRRGESYTVFITRRFFRLFPAYLICIAIAIPTIPFAIEALEMLPWSNAHNVDRIQIFADSITFFPQQLIAHLTMLHGLLPQRLLPSAPYALLGQAWSISLEWQYYLVAPLLFTLCTKHRGMAVIFYSAIVIHIFTRNWLPSSLPPALWLFVAGMASHLLWKRAEELPPWNLALLLVTVPVSLACKSAALAIWIIVLYSLLLAKRNESGLLSRSVLQFLQLKPVRFLGRISYPLYLCHMSMLYLVLSLLMPHAQTLGQDGHLMILALTTLGLSIPLAFILHFYIELPGISLGKWLTRHSDRRDKPQAMNLPALHPDRSNA